MVGITLNALLDSQVLSGHSPGTLCPRPDSGVQETTPCRALARTGWGRFRKRKKSYAKRALMPPRRGIGRTHGKRCLKVCNAASLSVFSDEQHGFFGVDFVMRNVQLEVLRIHQRL